MSTPDRSPRVLPEALADLERIDEFTAWLDEELAGLCVSEVSLDLSALDLDDPGLCAALAAELRDRGREVRLALIAPPQVLAHTLYRIGATLGSGAVEIIDPRSEVGTAS